MFNNVLVGVDEHQGGRDAIALAKRLAAPGAEITLAHTFTVIAARGASDALAREEREHGREVLAAAREKAGIEARLSCVAAASVGRGLHELAEAEQADLLVVGSCRRGLLGRVLMGDDARAALDGAPCAVAIAPAGYARETSVMREIGVGYDGSPESEYAVEIARQLAREHGATVSAFEAVSLPAYLFGAAATPAEEWFEDIVAEARKRVSALEGVEPHAAYGHAAEELALYSASLDLLVVGSRGYGPVGRLVHGSTSRQLARSARCPLLVLSRSARRSLAADDASEVRAVAIPAGTLRS